MKSKTESRWRSAKLGEVCEIVMGQSPEGASYNFDGRGEPLLNGPTEFGPEHPLAVQWTTSPAKFCEPGDILFCVRGATTGRKNIADRRYCIGRGLAAIRGAAKQADTKFLSFVLDVVTEKLLRETAGSTFPNLPGDKLAKVEFPLPPLDEQRRIAARLRGQMAEVERARAAVQAQLDTAQSLPAALLRAIFTSPAAQRWPRQPFGELVVNHDGSRVPLKHSDRTSRQGLYPYYGASGIIDHIDDYLFDGEFLLIGEDGANLRARSTPIAFRASGRFWVNNHAHVVQPKPGIRMEFLEHYFAALDLSRYVTGSAQPKLSQGILNEIPFLVPPPDEQQELATRLESELAAATQLSQSLETRLAEIELLPAALLREAFAG